MIDLPSSWCDWVQKLYALATNRHYPETDAEIMVYLLYFIFLSHMIVAHSEPCNPKKDEGCVAKNAALHGLVTDSLTSTSGSLESSNSCPLICFHDNGTRFGIIERYDNPRLASSEYILYGKVEADIMGAPGRGIISSFYLQSDDLDEIDIAEVFGDNEGVFQTNFFVKGDVATYGDGAYHPVTTSTTHNFHRYGVRWTEKEIEWSIDGTVVRHKAGGGLPTSPMRVILSLWVGGDETNNPGTVAWAGGLTDFSKLPFSMYAKNVFVENYSKGDYYVYGKESGVSVENETRANSFLSRLGITRPAQ